MSQKAGSERVNPLLYVTTFLIRRESLASDNWSSLLTFKYFKTIPWKQSKRKQIKGPTKTVYMYKLTDTAATERKAHKFTNVNLTMTF